MHITGKSGEPVDPHLRVSMLPAQSVGASGFLREASAASSDCEMA